ncbi:MAG: 16S rRNA (cytosine(1402)-N(4))-methyltransferase RsmH [Candidatus Saccharibacteria bacterium]|nr:16S rRNA (cytosine(1402)-N(4))-methyltransferase RsmH [Candidatus Saccharibacteria bacterium]
MTTPQQLHIPVLLDDVLKVLSPAQGEYYLDLTAGYGGHARQVINHIGGAQYATLCDRDDYAIDHLTDLANSGATIIHSDYLAATQRLVNAGSHYDMILLDLGVSSPQLDQSNRGFSFIHDGPLDMRMDRDQELTAAIIINRYSERDIIDIFEAYGEIPSRQAAAIARAIAIRRKRQSFETTNDLAEVIRIKVGELDHGKHHKTHPATKAFQALRIAVNNELGQLRQTLPNLVSLLNPNGRLAIITFHSLEDRIVKDFLRDQADGLDAPLSLLLKKPRGDTMPIKISGRSYAHSIKVRVAK